MLGRLGLEEKDIAHPLAFIDFRAYGTGKPLSIICFRRTKDAATMAKVVRTAPMPQEKTRAVPIGSVSLMMRR